jgi:hypothetical protein
LTREIERKIGLFDVAISFSGDQIDLAETIRDICTFHGLRCYLYVDFVENQSGLDILEIMRFAFGTTKICFVINSMRYRATEFTVFEWEILSKRLGAGSTIVIELGGEPLTEHISAIVINELSTQNIVEALLVLVSADLSG